MISPGFHLELNHNTVSREAVDLYTYSRLTINGTEFIGLASLRVDLVSHMYCPERFKDISNQNNHLCGEIEESFIEEVTKYIINETKTIRLI